MKRIIFILVILLSSTNLKAEFDTLWTKDDYRIFKSVGFLNDSIVLIRYETYNTKDTVSTDWSNRIRSANYNVNSMTFTNFYELEDSANFLIDITLNLNKTKLVSFNSSFSFDSLLVHNTSDGSLDTILTFNDKKVFHNVSPMYNGNIAVVAESTTSFTTKGRGELLLGEISLSDYSSTFYKAPLYIGLDYTDIDINIRKSYRSNIEKEIIIYEKVPGGSQVYTSSYIFDDDFPNRNEASATFGYLWRYEYNERYDNINIRELIYYNNDENFLVEYYDPDVFNGVVLSFHDSKDNFNLDSFKNKIKYEGSFMNFSYDNNYVIVKKYYDDSTNGVNSIMKVIDIENSLVVDSLELDFRNHPIIERPYRIIQKLEFINDSTAYSIIGGTVIKFYFNTSNLDIDEKENNKNLKIYPNPTSGIINLEYNSLSSENVNIEIVNELGEVMGNYQKQVFAGVNTLNYDITSYPKGIYFVRIKEQNITFKVVKE